MNRVFLVFLLVLAGGFAQANQIVISGVPSYQWYHGCEPTSIGMIMGYWDAHGYPNLFNLANVEDEISSPAHNAKYDPTPDNTALPTPAFTSIADWCGTSVDPLQFGYSYATSVAPAVAGFASYKGYTFTTANFRYNTTWNALVNEINNNRPMLFFVDSSGLGTFDHAVPVIGYDDQTQMYACYTTASTGEIPVWKNFQPLGAGNVYGVYGAIKIVPSPVPEPGSLAILLLALPGLWLPLRKRFR